MKLSSHIQTNREWQPAISTLIHQAPESGLELATLTSAFSALTIIPHLSASGLLCEKKIRALAWCGLMKFSGHLNSVKKEIYYCQCSFNLMAIYRPNDFLYKKIWSHTFILQ